MKKQVEIENNKYKIITDYRDGFDLEEFKKRYTDYFENYDYIVGDWAYGKLRLKGFYEDGNKNSTKINKISNLDKYIKESCAYGCKYFVAKRIIV